LPNENLMIFLGETSPLCINQLTKWKKYISV